MAILILISQLCSRVGTIGFEILIQKQGSGNRLDTYYVASVLGSVLTVPIAIAGSFPEFNFGLTIFIIVSSCFVSFLRVNTAAMIYERKIKLLSITNFLQSITQILLYWITSYTHNAFIFFQVWVLNVVIFSILTSYLMRSEVDFKKLFEFRLYLKNSLDKWGEGLQYSATAIPEMALTFSIELPIVKLVMGGNAAGLYAIAVTLNSMLYQVFVVISSIVAKNSMKFNRLLYYSVLSLMTLLGITASRPAISILFGEDYANAASFSLFLLPATFVLGVARIEQMTSSNSVAVKHQIILSLMLVFGILSGYFIQPNILVLWIAGMYILFAISTIFLVVRPKILRR